MSDAQKATKTVYDCQSVEEFIRKYYKRLQRDLDAWGPKHMQEKINSREADIAADGYTLISHHDSMTGFSVAYRPSINNQAGMAEH